MKKFLSFALSLIMAVAISVPAFMTLREGRMQC